VSLDEKRKLEILLAAKKIDIRREMALRDIANVKRNAGNVVKEPEMVAIKATAKEIVELAMGLIEEVFVEQMNTVS